MYMRLAFAVAINVDADILLIDEILAVGDAAFQAKCFNKLQEIKAKGTTIVIVSHSMAQIEQICERSIWIDAGKIRLEGSPRDVHPHYLEFMSQKTHLDAPNVKQQEAPAEAEIGKPEATEEKAPTENNGPVPEEPAATTPEIKTRWGSGEATMQTVTVLDADGKERYEFSPEEKITVRIAYTAEKEL